MRAVHGVEIGKVSDRTFLMHLGGKLTIESKLPIRNRDDLSMIYTPGVARVCLAIAENPEDARRLTIKRNTVAVVTDGSAVLGLGNIGPLAALPVMEGKAALFKRFAGIDALPICLDTQDVDEIVAAVKAIAPGFAGINLEDISAPRCFEVEARLREELDIPVFHDDQHGTAIVVLAALRNALRVVGKDLTRVRVVMTGAGAAGTAILKLLLRPGVTDVVVADYHGVVHGGRPDLSDDGETNLGWIAATHQPRVASPARCKEAVAGADVFIGVSAPNVLTGDDIATMADGLDRLRARQPRPRGGPGRGRSARRRRRHRAQRLRQPDQQRAGLSRASSAACSTRRTNTVSDDVLLAAANALAEVVTDDELNPTYIIPSVFNPDVAKVVAAAVEAAARSAAPGAPATVAADASRSHTGASDPSAEPAAAVPSAVSPVAASSAGPLGG